jgi:hypothetical protein
MWRRVDFVLTDVREECIASIFMVEKSAREESALAAATCWRWFLVCKFFYPENGGDTIFGNVGSHKN